MQKILGGPSGSIGSVGGGSDTAGSKTGATEPVTPAPVSPARIGDGPGEQRTGAQSPPVMMSPEMLKTILAESMAMGMQIAGASAKKPAPLGYWRIGALALACWLTQLGQARP